MRVGGANICFNPRDNAFNCVSDMGVVEKLKTSCLSLKAEGTGKGENLKENLLKCRFLFSKIFLQVLVSLFCVGLFENFDCSLEHFS